MLFHYELTSPNNLMITGSEKAGSAAELRKRLSERLASKGYRIVRVGRSTRKESKKIQGDPIKRVMQVIFEEAHKSNSSEIRITRPRAESEKPMKVFFLIKTKLHEVMGMPTYLWPPLRDQLAEMAGLKLREDSSQQIAHLQFEYKGKSYPWQAVFRKTLVRLKLETEY